MSNMVDGLKRVAIRVPPEETCPHCGQAVRGCEDRKFGFLLSEGVGSEFAKVRFLGPMGFHDSEVRKSNILGVVGETFFCSMPSQPEVCERVVFFDRGRQRKGWVEEVRRDGKVILAVGDETKERWVEELVILSSGEGFHRLSDKEVQELDSFGYEDKNSSSAFKREKRRETKGGDEETTELLERAERGAEELRALLAELADNT